ncbi:hypothetical protein ACFFU8_09010 [Chromobacterium piscinae]|uniref:hypothetical protein n=1 Tax=Chromobacterium piscinae TaxID=686831 RepID=UPI001E57CDF4|nr:hypothetical protein [Chromobacterium piscinae]MCD5327957.1 hypothetical protein [Chromobacterium piscinae]
MFADTKRAVIEDRKVFFEEMIRVLNDEPTEIDFILGQQTLFVPACQEKRIIDADRGNLLIYFYPVHNEITYQLAWSVYQIGEMLKIGLLVQNSQLGELLNDRYNQFDGIWDGTYVRKSERGAMMMFEWSFTTPNLYSNWAVAETYVRGLRHAHFRVLKLLSEAVSKAHGAIQAAVGGAR